MYQVLYRKYRPKCFKDVYGQDHIITTLKNELNNGRISHAYLFTGSRGTGKTTCAKILAKAVNCEHPVDGEPCNECEVCKGLDNGTIYDVVEIDAASNNGVDNIRDLREEVNYAPSRGKYRVYIIDEVHMLSQGAFNALLKTLEEPPAHVIFILATTEVHKIPATILSRCQRFDFKRIQPETMAERLQEVSKLENLTLDDDAAVLIARIADGALRNGLSILDQCAGVSKEITSKIVSEVAGIAGKEALYELTNYICNKDSNSAISLINDLYQNSYDMQQLCVEMINHFRNLLVAKTVKKNRSLIICTDDEYNAIVETAKNFTLENIIYVLNLFQDTLVTIKGGANARIEVEMTFIKLCEPKLEQSIDSLIERVSALERAVKSGICVKTSAQPVANNAPQPQAQKPVERVENTSSVSQNQTPVSAQRARQVVDEPRENDVNIFNDEPPAPPVERRFEPPVEPRFEQQAPPQPRPQTADNNQNAVKVEFDRWGEFMDELAKHDMPMFGLLCGSKAYVRGNTFIIQSSNRAVEEILKSESHARSIKKALFDVTGIEYQTRLAKNKTQEQVKRDPLEDLINNIQGNVDIDLK